MCYPPPCTAVASGSSESAASSTLASSPMTSPSVHPGITYCSGSLILRALQDLPARDPSARDPSAEASVYGREPLRSETGSPNVDKGKQPDKGKKRESEKTTTSVTGKHLGSEFMKSKTTGAWEMLTKKYNGITHRSKDPAKSPPATPRMSKTLPRGYDHYLDTLKREASASPSASPCRKIKRVTTMPDGELRKFR